MVAAFFLLKLKLNEWWISKIISPCYKVLLSFIPVCINWECWKLRNWARYEGKLMDPEFMVDSIKGAVVAVFSKAALVSKVSMQNIILLQEWGVNGVHLKIPKVVALKLWGGMNSILMDAQGVILGLVLVEAFHGTVRVM
ncbi:hypothetical protein LguiA_027526 [Lonicera macranthoides]